MNCYVCAMATETNNGKKGGLLKGKPHSKGGIKAVVTDSNQMVELEGGEVIINKEASKKHWKELSRINQSAGGGVPILPPNDSDADPDEYGKGGTITFNPNHLPSKWMYQYAKKIKDNYPKVWDVGGNVFGNEAFKNLERVLKRGYWTDSEEWMYKKWQSFNARHSGDIRIAGIIANLKWLNKVDKGWAYMKDLIEEEIAKKYPEKKAKGGSVEPKLKLYEITSSKSKALIGNTGRKGKGGYVTEYTLYEGDKKLLEISTDYINYRASNSRFSGKTPPYAPKLKGALQFFKKYGYDLPIDPSKDYGDEFHSKEVSPNLVWSRFKNTEPLSPYYSTQKPYIHPDLKKKMEKGGVVTYKQKFNKKYGFKKDESHTLSEVAKETGRSKKGLQQIYNKGIGAYKTNPESVRPNVKSKEQWAMARVYSAVMGGKASRVDKHELAMAKGGKVVESLIKQGKIDLKFYDTTPKHAKEYGLKSRNPLYIQNISVSKNERLKGVGKKVLAYIDEYAIKNGNDVVFGHITQEADFTKDDREAIFSNINMIKNWLKSNGYVINDDNNDFHKVIKLAKGGITLPPEGTLIAKDKKSKLDYKKIGNNYEFSVHDGEPNAVENHSRVQFKKRNGNKVTMTYDQFINYIYAEGFIDDKAKGGELAKGIKEEGEHRNTAEKLYNRQITPSQAPKSIAKEHLEEDPHYYSKLEKLKTIPYAQGGTTGGSTFDYKKAISLLRGSVKIGNTSWKSGQFVTRDSNGFLVDNNGDKNNFDKLFNSGEPNGFYLIDNKSTPPSPKTKPKNDDDSESKVQFFTLNDPDDLNAIPDSVEQNLFAVYPTSSQDEPVQVSFKQRFEGNNGKYYLTIDVYYSLDEVVKYITNGLWKPYGEEQEPREEEPKEQKPKEKKSQQKQPKPSAPKPPKKKEQKPKKKKFDTSEALRKYLKTSNVDNVFVDSPSSIAKEIATQFSITMEGLNDSIVNAINKGLEQLSNT